MPIKILLVEDNPHIQQANRKALVMRGYHVLEAETLAQGRELLLKEQPDLIILDVMLPDGSGLGLCEEIRKDSNIPILFLSGLKEEKEIIDGFESGGDVYLTKPYGLNVLVKNVEALLNRSKNIPDMLVKGRLILNIISNIVTLDGKDLLLSPKEFSLLLLFAQHEGETMSAEYIYEKVWKAPLGNNKGAFEKTISVLRKKITLSGYEIDFKRGQGYSFKKNN